MLAPAPIAIKQWANTYNMGHYCGPPLAIVSALATGWCAWNRESFALSCIFFIHMYTSRTVPATFHRITCGKHIILTNTIEDTTSPQYKLNLAATVLIPSIIPFTFAFIVPTNNALFEKKRQLADVEVSAKDVEVGVKKEETVHALIDKWATLNLARALLVGLGSVCAVWGAVGRMEGVRRSVL